MLNITYETLSDVRKYLFAIKSSTILVLNKSSAKRWDLETCAQNENIIWINEVDNNPTPKTLYNAMTKINSSVDFNEIIAIGGGSSIDLTKGILAFLKEANNIPSVDYIRDKIKNKKYLENFNYKKPLFTVLPTTSGTGSEATKWATIWDDTSPAKFSIDAAWLMPDKVILSADFTLHAPLRLTATTGLDAVSHAVEAYWAKSSDMLSKELALAALSILVPELSNLAEKHKNDNLNWREKLATGAYISGLAFSRTRTTACHSISYPMTSLFGVEHGFAVALTLGPVAEINSKVMDLKPLFKVFESYGGIKAWIYSATKGIVEMDLSYFGITSKDIPIIVGNAFTGGRMDNNPAETSEIEITKILKSLIT